MIAISIASDKGLDLITSEDHIHYALATKNTNAVYTSMLKHQIPSTALLELDRSTKTVHALAQVLMLTNFHVSRLTAKEIASI